MPQGGPTPSAAGAEVYFPDLTDGAVAGPSFTVHFDMGVSAGSSNSGHHHLLIDTDLPPLDQPIPNDPRHLHFGAGQTEAAITSSGHQRTFATKTTFRHSPPLFSQRITVHGPAPVDSNAQRSAEEALDALASEAVLSLFPRIGLAGMG